MPRSLTGSFSVSGVVQVVTSASDRPAINWLEQLTKLRETFTYIYQFIKKDITKDTDEQPTEEVHGGEVRKGPELRSFCPWV